MSIKKSARRCARELVVQGLYSWLIDPKAEVGVIQANLQEQEGYAHADIQLFDTLFHGVIQQADSLRQAFEPYIDRPVQELSMVEHAVLLMGTYELMHLPEIPYRVVMNEMVELTKEFGGTDGFKFVNGVLDKLASQVRSLEVKAQHK